MNLNLQGTGLSVADVDSSSGTATLSVGEGTLTISAGATGATIGGSGGSVTIAGTIAQINAVLAGSSGATIVYVDNTNTPSANTTLTLSMTDGSTSTSDTATISITAVNDAPAAVITPPTYSATEQVALNLKGTGLSVSDADASGAVETVTLSVSEGTLTVTAGGSGAQVSGSGSGTVMITGTIAQINALLDGDATSAVGYTDGTDNPSATATLTLGINDGGSSGTGGPKTGSDTATINITAANDAPDLTVPGSTVNGTPGTPITINGVTFADGDEGTGPEQATFTAAAGTFTAVDNGGVTVSGSGTNIIVLTGTTAALSAFIGANNLTYTTTTSQTVSVTLSDLGHTGTPGADPQRHVRRVGQRAPEHRRSRRRQRRLRGGRGSADSTSAGRERHGRRQHRLQRGQAHGHGHRGRPPRIRGDHRTASILSSGKSVQHARSVAGGIGRSHRHGCRRQRRQPGGHLQLRRRRHRPRSTR